MDQKTTETEEKDPCCGSELEPEAAADEHSQADAPASECEEAGDAGDGSPDDGDQARAPEDEPEEAQDEGEAALAAAKAEAAVNYDRFLRASAELDNLRKRTVRLRSDSREEALRDVLLQVAPLLDNMRRALAQETDDAAALRQGVELIQNQFQDVLKGYGLEEIEAVGKPFDPNYHDAMMEVPTDEHPPGTVVQEMEKGYALRDKVVRPSRVVVSKAPEEGE